MSTKESEILSTLSSDWAGKISMADKGDGLGTRMFDRPTQIERKDRFINRYLNEYVGAGSSNVLDIGCGSGTFLECMRYYGCEVMGTELRRFSFLESQDIPHIEHDCHVLPLPFDDDSYNLVTCLGVFGQLRPFMVPDILSEFFRISTDVVLVRVNSAKIMEAYSSAFDNPPPGWEVIFNDSIVVKYIKVGE